MEMLDLEIEQQNEKLKEQLNNKEDTTETTSLETTTDNDIEDISINENDL